MASTDFQATTSDDGINTFWWIEIEGIKTRFGSPGASEGINNHSTLGTSLEAYWKLDEDATDSSGSGRHGSATGIDYGAGALNECAQYRDQADKIDITGWTGLTSTPISCAFWVKFSAKPSENVNAILEWGGGIAGAAGDAWIVKIDKTGGHVKCEFGTGQSQEAATDICDGSWHHVAVTCPSGGKPTDVKIYVDGDEDTPYTTGGTTAISPSSAKDVQVGYGTTSLGGDRSMHDGDLDEVAIWSKELTSSEVTDLYNLGSPLPLSRSTNEYFAELPQITGQVAEPLNGSTQPHEFTIKLLDVNDEITALFSVADTSYGYSTLSGNHTASDTTITVSDGSQFSADDVIYVDRESMLVHSVSGNVLTVTRGMYNSEAVEHNTTDDQGNTRTVTVYSHPPYIYTREVILFENRDGLAEEDAISFRGYIDDYHEDDGIWTIHCSGHLRRLNSMIGETLAKSSLAAALGDEMPPGGTGVNGPEPPTSWVMKLYDASEFQSGGGHVVVDEEIIEYQTTSGNSLRMSSNTDFGEWTWQSVANARGKFAKEILGDGRAFGDPIQVPGTSDYYTLSVWCRRHEKDTPVREIIHSNTIYDGLSLTRPTPLQAHQVILAFLLSVDGDGSNNATYDVLPTGWGVGIDSARVDITGIENVCDDPHIADVNFDPFAIADPVDCKEWLEENILRPCHLFFYETDEGKISIARLYSKNEAAELTTPTALTESELLNIPSFRPGAPPFGEFKINIGYHPARDEFMGLIRVLLGDGRVKYKGMARNFEIDCKTAYDWRFTGGVGSKVSTIDMDIPELLSRYLEIIWSNHAEKPCPVVEFSVAYNRLIDVQLGQVITLTSTQTPDVKNSNRGLSTEYFQVIEAHPNPQQSSVDLVCWMIGINDDDTRLLAPAAKVASYDNVNHRATLYDTTFTDGIKYTYDIDAFAVGDEVMFVDSSYDGLGGATPEHGPITAISASTGSDDGYIEFASSPPNNPSDGDYAVTASYDDCSSTQKGKWAYLADSSETLGSSGDDAHKYER